MAKEPEKTAQEIALDAKLAELDAKMNAMLDLEARLKTQAPSGGIDAATLEQILARTSAAAGKATEAMAKKFVLENPDHLNLGISPFEHPQGGLDHPKPEFHREIFWGRPLSKGEVTYAELLACNALSESLARSQRRIARDGKWVAKVSDDDQRLTITVPVKTIDDRQDLPAFIQIVQELTSGEKAKDQADILAELALLREQVKELQGAGA